MAIVHSTLKTHYNQLFINGCWQGDFSGEDQVIHPANEEVVGSIPIGGATETELALAAARQSFDNGHWSSASREVRASAMERLFDRIKQRREEALGLMQLEMGYTRMQCDIQLDLLFTQMAKFIELSHKDPQKSLPMMTRQKPDGSLSFGGAVVARDPIGVVSAITPYNSGFLLGLMKSVPALACGNSVVLKPSPFTPLQSFLIAEIIAELDLPPGVFNLVTGGVEVGQMMSGDPRVDMVTFTGSDAVGGQVMAQAAPTLKKVHLELGGKSPLIVRRDADMEKAMVAGMFGFVHQSGQGCSMTTRMLVDNRIRQEFVDNLRQTVANLKIGDPYAEDTFMGPLIREAAVERTEMFCQRAQEEGAELVYGGKRPEGFARGFFFEPTIFNNVDNKSYLGQREVFGPIAAVIGFDSDEEAIKLANDTDYGLGGAIISEDKGTAFEMALKMRTGQININEGPGGFHPDMPFGGYKRSGLGREWGEEGFYEYTEIKAIGFPAG